MARQIGKWLLLVCLCSPAAVGLLAAGSSAPATSTAPASGPAGATTRASSSDELIKALQDAGPGARILVAPGQYVLSVELGAAPLTIEAADPKDRPVLSPADGPFVLDIRDMEGTVSLRGLVFDGGKKKAGALRTRNTRLEVEDCRFRDFWGIDPAIMSACGKDRSAHRGLGVSRCAFQRNPNKEKDSDMCGSAIGSFGPAVVEDCVVEDVRGGLCFYDESSLPRRDYKVIVRRNRIYRTEGTDWKCHAIVTRTTAPEVYENVIHDLSKGDCSAMTIASNGLDKKGTPTAALVYRNVIIDRWKAADSGMIHESIEYGEYHPTKGRIFENVLVARVGASPSLYNKSTDSQWYNNTLYGGNRLFHCFGFNCAYYNNIMVGGRADGSYYSRKDMETDKAKAEVEVATLTHSCFLKVEHIKDREFVKGEGYFEADPKFVDPDNLDFHLRCDSPCINKGTGSRDGLTPTDLGAFEYPIQVCRFKVDATGRASWEWANDFRKVSRRVKIRWNARSFPTSHDRDGDATLAQLDAADQPQADTGKTSGYFAAFVLDAKDRWSGPTPDAVHQYAFGGSTKQAASSGGGPAGR
jgi:hypothetical protein